MLTTSKSPGDQFYKVDLPDEMIPKMLDWDKPLSQQPESVRKALADAWLAHPEVDAKLTGKQIYERAGITLEGKEGPQASADLLRKAGVPGIRYLDQGSRASGKGTYNYVVFPGEEAALKILERNGQPLGGMLPVAKPKYGGQPVSNISARSPDADFILDPHEFSLPWREAEIPIADLKMGSTIPEKSAQFASASRAEIEQI